MTLFTHADWLDLVPFKVILHLLLFDEQSTFEACTESKHYMTMHIFKCCVVHRRPISQNIAGRRLLPEMDSRVARHILRPPPPLPPFDWCDVATMQPLLGGRLQHKLGDVGAADPGYKKSHCISWATGRRPEWGRRGWGHEGGGDRRWLHEPWLMVIRAGAGSVRTCNSVRY